MKKLIAALAGLAMISLSLGADSKQEKEPLPQSEQNRPVAKPDAERRQEDCHCGGYAEASVCPKQPIAVYDGGTLYDADYYDPDCDASPQTTYMFGDFDWPWHICPDDCQPPTRGASEFQGLPEAVGLDYMHTRPNSRSGKESCLPGGPARRCCRVNPSLNNLFLSFSEGGTRYAKVLQFEVNYEMALYRPDKDHWTKNYVAFEVASPPSLENEIQNVSPTPVKPANDHIRRARIRVGVGQMEEVLILLKK